MHAAILTLHTLLILGLIVVVLLQRSDGGALGIGGGGGGGGGFMSGRGAANALTRTTSILAALFFSTSIILAILAGGEADEESAIEGLTGEVAPKPGTQSEGPSAQDILRSIGVDEAESLETREGARVPMSEDEVLRQITEPAGNDSPSAGEDAPASAPQEEGDAE